MRGKFGWFFSNCYFLLILAFLWACAEPAPAHSPVTSTDPSLSTSKTEADTLPQISAVNWDANSHTIQISLQNCPSTWSHWKIMVDGKEIPTGEGSGEIILRPNAPLTQPPDGLIIGTLPWVSGLDRMNFPCCGSLQISIPTIGMTNSFTYNLKNSGCTTASTKNCPSNTSVVDTNKQAKASHENMVLIPAGSFKMGRQNRKGWTPMAGPEIFNDELPAHDVYVNAFYIDAYEVTNAQFKEFVDATHYITDAEKHGASDVMVPIKQAQTPLQGSNIGWRWTNGANWRHPEGPASSIEDRMNHPVVHVSWNDANAYAKWAGKRLPTEAEWEKAARGGTVTNWFWSDTLDGSGKFANIYAEHRLDYQYPKEVFDGFTFSAPVGSLLPNAFGIYDTAGNVFEWTADWYEYDYFKASPKENPKGPASGTSKVIKGGAWYFCECYMRPANRQDTEINSHDQGLGFRLAMDVD